jgi:hypothetical protein
VQLLQRNPIPLERLRTLNGFPEDDSVPVNDLISDDEDNGNADALFPESEFLAISTYVPSWRVIVLLVVARSSRAITAIPERDAWLPSVCGNLQSRWGAKIW